MKASLARSAPFKIFALLSALSVLGALVVHAGCSNKAATPPTPPAVASVTVAPAASSVAPVVSAAPAIVAPAPSGLPPIDLSGDGNGSNIHMGTSKSGAAFRHKDVDAAALKQNAPSNR